MMRVLEEVARVGAVVAVILYYLGYVDLSTLINAVTVIATMIVTVWLRKYGGRAIKGAAKLLRPRAYVIRTVKGVEGSVIVSRRCKICSHSQRAEIEKLLLQGATYEAVSERFGVAVGTISKHFRNHMPRLIMDEEELKQLYERHRVRQIDLAEELYRQIDRLEELYQRLAKVDEKFEAGKVKSLIGYVDSIAERRNLLKEMREVLLTMEELGEEVKSEKDLSELLRKLKEMGVT